MRLLQTYEGFVTRVELSESAGETNLVNVEV